jgi:hypothetical protein
MPVSRRTALKTLGAAGLLAASGALAARRWADEPLGLTRVTIPITGLPPALNGLRIGFLTDVHRSQWVSHDDVEAAVVMLMREGPDLIALGGDYVTWRDRAYIGPAADALASLSAPHGVFAVLGNHDDEREVPAALAKRGIEMLLDARTAITIRHETVDLLGVRFWERRSDTVASLAGETGRAAILLAHDPRRLPEAAAAGVSLVLAGHTHGGQVVLPLLGPIAARRFPVVAGVAREAHTSLFVSRGLGTVYVPVRINCPPEVALVTLSSSTAERPA